MEGWTSLVCSAFEPAPRLDMNPNSHLWNEFLIEPIPEMHLRAHGRIATLQKGDSGI